MSYTNSSPNSITGIPTTDPFLWENGKMLDLGSLGGTFGAPNFINELGQVVGQMDLSGDLSAHPFLWDRGSLKDLGTFGGDDGEANWINDSGEVVGGADYPGSILHHAFLWKQGVMKDLGTVADDKCSVAFSINSNGQIVGGSGMCGVQVHAFLWENGTMIDLNSLVTPGVQLFVAYYINDLGEIACEGYVPGEEHSIHDFLLVPAKEGTASDSGNSGDSGPAPFKQIHPRVHNHHRMPSRGPIE
jgi:probable HAF family extracellular repeat protein